jgi:hypothetical protein
MSTVIHCPSCNRNLRVPANLMGQRVKCPSCDAVFVAEQPSGEEPILEFAEEQTPTQPSRPRDLPGEEQDDERESPPRRRRPHPRPEEDYDEELSEEEAYDQQGRTGRRRRRMDMAPHRGTLILVLGILGFFFLPFVLGPMAWIMGSNDLKEMRARRMDPEGEGMTNAGRICGIVSTIIGFSCLFVSCLGFILARLANRHR